MTTDKGKVLEKILHYKGEIAENNSKIRKIESVLNNIKRLNEMSDQDIRTQLNNERFYSSDNWCGGQLMDYTGKELPISHIMGFANDHVGTIDDPLVRGLVQIERDDYAMFSFGDTADPNLLSKVLNRSLPLKEYLGWLAGDKPIVTRDGSSREERKECFIQRPENYDALVGEYKSTHPGTFKELKPRLKFYKQRISFSSM